MKIIRFFLSNVILITFFCAVIYAYYYWDNLTGEETPVGQTVAYLSKEFKSVGSFIEGIKSKQTSNEDVATESVAPVVVVEEKEVVVTTAKRDVFVTPEIEESINKVVNDQVNNQSAISTVETQSNTDANRAIWIDARKAFYKRDYDAAILSYQQVISNSTDNFDAYGELGNVYFNQGKKVEAAAAYYEAAALLVKLGQTKRANSLLPLLNYLDSEKADQLKELMAAS